MRFDEATGHRDAIGWMGYESTAKRLPPSLNSIEQRFTEPGWDRAPWLAHLRVEEICPETARILTLIETAHHSPPGERSGDINIGVAKGMPWIDAFMARINDICDRNARWML